MNHDLTLPDGPEPDPLAGRDPFPRHEIDLLALHDARRELLEEIVSTPGASSPAPSTRRALVAVGIAATLLLVLGGAWFATGIGSGDDPTVASGPTTEPADPPADEEAEPADPDQAEERDPDDVRVNGVEVGRVVPVGKCRRLLDDDRPLAVKRLRRLDVVLEGRRAPRYVKLQRRGDVTLYFIAGHGRRWIALDDECRVVESRDRRGDRD